MATQNELDLVQRVYDRIAAAATDDQLQAELLRYLAPVINKLNSSQDIVRSTVMEVLSHVNRRVKDHQHIQLPVEALILQFSAPEASAFVVNFSLVYIKMGFPRLDGNKQLELLGALLTAIENRPAQQNSLLALLLPVLAQVKGNATHSATATSPLMQLRSKPQLAKTLLDYMQDILLLPYGTNAATQQQLVYRQQQVLQQRQLRQQQQEQQQQQQQQRQQQGQQQEEDDEDLPSEPDSVPVPGIPAGMSITSYRRAIGDRPLKADELEKLKLTVVRFLDTEILTPSSMALAVIIASSDTRFSVANIAESLLRRMDSTIEWNGTSVISGMYILFLGTLTPIETTPVERFKNPANTRIRLKLMPCFLKSREATNFAPLAVKVFCECLWGSFTNSKLKQQGISFLHHISFNASTEKLKPVGSMLFSGVVKVIDEEKNDAKLTSLAYGALAKLSLTLPNLLLSHTSQLHYLQTLMDALTHEVGDVLLAIQEALSMVAPVCKQLSPHSQEQLCIILSDHVQNENPALRRTAVHYAASVFPQTHFASRFILLLATGDSQDDIRLEATRELYRSVGEDSSGNPRHETPGFAAMLRYTVERMNATPRTRWRDVANTPIPYSLRVMEELLLYLQHCLAVESGSNLVSGNSGSAVASFRDGALMWPDCTAVGSFVQASLAAYDGQGKEPFRQFLGLCEMAANAWSSSAVEAIVRVVAVAPALLAPHYIDRTDWIRRFLIRAGHAGQVAALLFGVVAGQVADLDKFEKIIQSIRSSKDLRLDSQECCILATGHSLAMAKHRLLRDEDVVMEDDWHFFDTTLRDLANELVNCDPGLQSSLVVALGEVARFTPLPVPVGDIAPLLPKKTTKDKDSGDTAETMDTSTSAAPQKTALKTSVSGKKEGNLANLFSVLSSVYENTKLTSKVREQAIQTVGHLCVGQPDIPLKHAIIQSLLDLSGKSGELEIHFSVGGALADCVMGQDSASARNLWTEEDPTSTATAATEAGEQAAEGETAPETQDAEMHEKDSDEMMEKEEKLSTPATPSCDKQALIPAAPLAADAGATSGAGEAMEVDVAPSADVGKEVVVVAQKQEVEGSLGWLLQQLLHKYVPMTKPSVRQASCIWLLTVLKRCRYKPEVQRDLIQIQGAFMSLLADTNELVQDAASKGLCVVYECCSEATQRSMVEGLVHALTEGKSRVSNVTSDTKLFREGELGSAPTGGQLSTYRELCSLASDLNQPDLVYKFMNLANHNAVWNSRKGAAFGFGSLAAQAGAQLEPYLPQIVPKLYRYQHDPTPRIQQPMAHIWSCLVTDTHKTTEKYYSSILADLLSSLTNNLWRVRESACGALCDLIRQHSVVPAVPHLATLWNTLFRVRDDIKESVRTAANKALQSLSKSCIKVCEASGTESQQVLEVVLPVLLTSGISSSVSEVRAVSLDAIVKVCRSGGAMIRPHLGTLVPALLEAVAGLEHQSLSYTSVRTTTEEDRDRFDSLRVAAARGTPMMDTLNYVLQYVDDQVIDSVIAGVVDILKRSVGLTSRTAAAHVVETLTHTCPTPLEKHAGKILTALVNGLNDRNATLRKVFANAIGTVVKVAKASSVEKLLNKLQTWYLEKEEDSVRMSAGITLRSMHRQSGDIMRDYASLALPLAFLAMHAHKTLEEDPTGTEVWEEIWQDNTPGTEAGLRLHLKEIMAVCEQGALSSNWAMKSQAGRALATLAEKVGKTLTGEQTTSLIELLINSLQGRTWAGKENLILALSTVAVSTKPVLVGLTSKEGEEALIEEVVKVLLREASKEKKEYKQHSVRALTTVLEEFELDKFELVFDICSPYIIQSNDNSSGGVGASTSGGGGAGSSSGAAPTDEDRTAEQQEVSVRWDLLDEMIRSLGRAWPTSSRKDTQERYSVRFVELLNSSVSKVPRKTQLTVIGSLGKYWERHYLLLDTAASLSRGGQEGSGCKGQTSSRTLDTAVLPGLLGDQKGATTPSSMLIMGSSESKVPEGSEKDADKSMPLYDPLQETQFDPVIQQSCKIFNYCLGISKYYSLRKQALAVLLEIVNRIKGNPVILTKVSSQVMAAVEEARRDAQPDIQDLAATLHKIIVTSGASAT